MIRFENVGMRYGAGPEVLSDITFGLEQGAFRPLVFFQQHVGLGKEAGEAARVQPIRRDHAAEDGLHLPTSRSQTIPAGARPAGRQPDPTTYSGIWFPRSAEETAERP